MISDSKKVSFKQELNEILSQFDNLQFQIENRKRMIVNKNDKLLFLENQVDITSQLLISATSIFSATNVAGLEADVKILDDRIGTISNLLNSNVPEIFSSIEKNQKYIQESFPSSPDYLNNDEGNILHSFDRLSAQKTHLITIAKKTNQLLNSIHERLKIIQNFKNIVEKFDNLTNNFEVEHKNLLDKIEKVEKFDYEKLVVFDVTEFTRGLDRLSSIQYELIRTSKESSGVEVYQNTNNQNILRHRRHSSNSRYEDWRSTSISHSNTLSSISTAAQQADHSLTHSDLDSGTCSPILPCQNFSETNSKISKSILKITDKIRKLKNKIENSTNTYNDIRTKIAENCASCKSLPNLRILKEQFERANDLESLELVDRETKLIIDQWTPCNFQAESLLQELIGIYPSKDHDIRFFMLEKPLDQNSSSNPSSKNSSRPTSNRSSRENLQILTQNLRQEYYTEFSDNLKNCLSKLKFVDSYGTSIFNLMHQIRAKMDEIEEIMLALDINIKNNEIDQDLVECKSRLKSLLKYGLLTEQIKEKLAEVEENLLDEAKIHSENQKIKFYRQEIDFWLSSVKDSLEMATSELKGGSPAAVSDVSVLELLESQCEKILETFKNKEEGVLNKWCELVTDNNQTEKIETDWTHTKTQVIILDQDLKFSIKNSKIYSKIYNFWSNFLKECADLSITTINNDKYKFASEVKVDQLFSKLENKSYNADSETMKNEVINNINAELATNWQKLDAELRLMKLDFNHYYSIKKVFDEFLASNSNFSQQNIDLATNRLEFYLQLKEKNYRMGFNSNCFLNLVNYYIFELADKIDDFNNKTYNQNLKLEFENSVKNFENLLRNDDNLENSENQLNLSEIQRNFNILTLEKFGEFEIPEEIHTLMASKVIQIEESCKIANEVAKMEEFLGSGCWL